MNTHSKVIRYALVGAGARSFMFSDALLDIYKRASSLVALCDVNQQRMDFHNQVYMPGNTARSPFPPGWPRILTV
jgi:predicted dehydrogenase